MKLELHKIQVKKWELGSETCYKNGTVTVNPQELTALLLEDERLESIELHVAHPGESVRILPVKDVIEPRCKLESTKEVFPGFIGDVETVGDGKTLVLDGAAVVTTGRLIAPQEGIIDMSGPGADYTPFSKTANLVIYITPKEGVVLHHFEHACRMVGLKTAHYVASKCKDNVVADNIESYDFPPLSESMQAYPDLPKVAYLYMLQSQGLMHDTWVYGCDAKVIVPTLISPTEIMDGAIVSGNCVSACDKNNTYVHLNNPVIKALFDRHGKDINFVGVIITNENVTLQEKNRSSNFSIKLALLLGVNGLVISEEGFGNPDADLIMNCWKAEKQGIRTVLITDEFAGRDGASQSLADACPAANACVTAGNANMLITLPPMDKVIGDMPVAENLAGGFFGSVKDDGSLEVEIQAIVSATNELGFTRNGARTL